MSLMSDDIYQVMSSWKFYAERQSDPFVRFFLLYMCLDSWMSAGSGSSSDSRKKTWLTSDENALRLHWNISGRHDAPFLSLVQIGRVKNMSPNPHPDRVWKVLSHDSDFSVLIEFIYQIRCNLFHGGKNPFNIHDDVLVQNSAEILEDWVSWLLTTTRQEYLS